MVTKRLIKGTCVNSKKVYYHYAHRDRIKRAAIKWLKKKKRIKGCIYYSLGKMKERVQRETKTLIKILFSFTSLEPPAKTMEDREIQQRE